MISGCKALECMHIYFTPIPFCTKLFVANFATTTKHAAIIAESNPKEKDVIIDLVMNFLNNEN